MFLVTVTLGVEQVFNVGSSLSDSYSGLNFVESSYKRYSGLL